MSNAASEPVRVLFVCLGNICRSPLAEGVFRHLAEEADLGHAVEVDSAGTGAYHVGEDPDPRSREVAERHGIHLEGHARQAEPRDFSTFDLVVAMDRSNRRDLERLGRDAGEAELRLLREFDPEAGDDLDVPDPYYGGEDGFDRVYEMVHRSCRALLDEIATRIDPGRE